MTPDRTHYEMILAAVRSAEDRSLDEIGRYLPEPRLVCEEGGAIVVRHPDHKTGLIRFRRIAADKFSMEGPGIIRGKYGWKRLRDDAKLATLLERWRRQARYSDLLLSPWTDGTPRERSPLVTVRQTEAPEPVASPKARAEVMTADAWLADPAPGPVELPAWAALANGPVHVSWDGAEIPSPAQRRAIRLLALSGRHACGALLGALYRDSVHFAEDPEFEPLRGPAEVSDHTSLRGIDVLAKERDGLAYSMFTFDSGWRVEHGLTAVMHGDRVVSVGGHTDHEIESDDGTAAPGFGLTEDAAVTASSWVEQPHDAVVALPMWEGLRGRFKVRFLCEDGEDERSDAQIAAAEGLVNDGAALRATVLGALVDAASKSAAAKTLKIRSLADVERVVGAREIRIHSEDLWDLAFVEARVEVPWKKNCISVVVHGMTRVAVTNRDGAVPAIEDYIDEAIRAKRRNAAKPRGAKS